MKKNEIEINGEIYVKKDSIKSKKGKIEDWITKNKDGKTMCMVRTYSSGVFYGWVDYENAENFNTEVFEAVRVWKWAGAFTLSYLSQEGTNDPGSCRFAIEIPVVKVNRWIELIPMSEKAIDSLNKVKRG